MQSYTPAEDSAKWPVSGTSPQESEQNRTMVFPGGCAERDEARLRYLIIKRTTKTASASTTAMATPAMYPALSWADEL
jgi:hypothetical protein